MYSYRVEQAIRAAAILHKNQLRKGSTPLPYITHLMAVTLIISDYTDDEDTIVATLLHDTLEDTDYTSAELQEDFGGDVKELVESLSEPQDTKEKKYSWLEQKKRYVTKLKSASQKALLISAADKIHNMRMVVEEYYDDHARFMADFGASLEDRTNVYHDISDVITSRLKNPIVDEYNLVYEEYKNFVRNVKKTKERQEQL